MTTQSVSQILAKTPLYTDNELYAILKLPVAGIIVAASIVAEISDPFCALIVDKDEVTLVVPHEATEEFAGRLRQYEAEASLYRLITFDMILSSDLVGFMAKISGVLAEAGVPIFPYAAYSRDHLLIPEGLFETAMKVLQKLKVG
ncbi:MAG TPA: ACT domain-containing protein [Phototrophicaceae bacterium]|jgi:hypothetical protein|nr:ACT domain-containing protein [Phototrophicaceae bacterium]